MSAESRRSLTDLPNSRETCFYLTLLSVMVNFFSLALPLTLMQVYDRIIPFNGVPTLFCFVVVCCVALILEGVLRYARSILVAWVSARYDYYYSCSAIRHVLDANIREFEVDGLGAHLDRINAVSTLKRYNAGQLTQILVDIPFAVFFVFVVAYLGGDVAMVPIIVSALFVGALSFVKVRFAASRDKQAVLNDRRFNFIIELLSGLHLVKAQSLEEQMLRRYERLVGSLSSMNSAVSFWGNVPINIGNAFSQLALLGVIGLGATRVMSGDLTLGGLAACTLLTGRAFQPVQSAAAYWMNTTEARISEKRLSVLLDLPPEQKEGIPPFPSDVDGSIELQKVSFRYGDELNWVLNGVDLKIEPGELVGFLGRSSSGTSTLMHIVSGRLRPVSGRCFIDDYDLSEWDVSSLRGRIEYIPQLGALFEGTVLENIAMFNAHSFGAALDAAALLGLDELVSLLPHGYETHVDNQSCNFLPNGLIQRICIARALVVRPRIIIFDKSSASLDKESEEVFDNLIHYMRGKVTILLVSSQALQLRNCDKVYELADGALVDWGKEPL